MGTPISKNARQAIERYSLHGEALNPETLYALGLDIKLFEQIHADVKTSIAQLEGYMPLEEVCRGMYTRERKKGWDVLVAEAEPSLTGVRVLRCTSAERKDEALLRFEGFLEAEVFLVRNGDWIVWDGSNYRPEIPASFTRHRTVRAMLKRLDQTRARVSRHEKLSYPALLLRENLIRFLDASIAAKQSRLGPLISLRADVEEISIRNGLAT